MKKSKQVLQVDESNVRLRIAQNAIVRRVYLCDLWRNPDQFRSKIPDPQDRVIDKEAVFPIGNMSDFESDFPIGRCVPIYFGIGFPIEFGFRFSIGHCIPTDRCVPIGLGIGSPIDLFPISHGKFPIGISIRIFD